MELLSWPIYILSSWLLADLLGGIVHWSQDIYLQVDSKYKFIADISVANELHHTSPVAMTKQSPWYNIQDAAYIGWPLSLGLLLMGAHPIAYLTFFFATFGNLVHRWAHIPKRRLNIIIRTMQWTGLFATMQHHNQHHFDSEGVLPKEQASIKFCPITNWLNPTLDYIGFWKFLESVLKRFGIKPFKEL